MKALLRRRPLRFTLPVAMLAVFLVLSAASLHLAGRDARAALVEAATARITQEGTRLRRLADDAPRLWEEIAQLHDPNGAEIRRVLLLSPEGAIQLRRGVADDRLPAPQAGDLPYWASADSRLSLLAPLDASGRRLLLEYDLGPLLARAAPRIGDHLPVLALGLALLGLLIALVQRNVSRPLAQLSEAARRIGQGELDTVIDMPGNGSARDEIGDLAVSLIEMNARLRADREALEHERGFLKTLVRTLPDLVWLKSPDGIYLACNPRFEKFFGAPEASIIGKTDYDFLDRGTADFFRANDRAALAANGPLVNEEEVTYASDGHRELLETTKTPMIDAQGRLIGVLGIARDVTASRRASEALRVSRDRLAEAERLARLGNWELDLKTQALSWSDETFRIFEFDPGNVTPTYEGFMERVHPEDRERVHHAYQRSVQEHRPYNITHRLLFADGRVKMVQERGLTLYGDDGGPLLSRGTVQDITERHQTEAELRRLAYFDALTGLPNRALLLERIGQALAVGRRGGRLDALLLINLDRFKTLNEAGGHGLGDQLLKTVAERLQGLLREGDTLARLSADEFAVLLRELDPHPTLAARRARQFADQLQAGLREPFALGEHVLAITSSLGISLLPDTARDTPTDALRRADIALHRAKDAGGNQSAFFDANMGEAAEQRFRVERELRAGIQAGELRLYLQSQVDASGRVLGAEALVRWQHPERGLVPPGLFIPVAEESALIVDIETWVLSQVCRLLASEDMAGRSLHLAANVSPRHFRQPGFVAWLRGLLTEHGADPTRLTLEVTEGLVIDDIGDAIAKMSELTALGVHFSIDDFGTGYSSLSYIKRLPIDELKIDRSFVQDAPNSPDDAALVDAILAVAGHLHLKVVAEGVETREQADFLNARGNLIHQGYLYGRPEPADDWLQRRLAER